MSALCQAPFPLCAIFFCLALVCFFFYNNKGKKINVKVRWKFANILLFHTYSGTPSPGHSKPDPFSGSESTPAELCTMRNPECSPFLESLGIAANDLMVATQAKPRKSFRETNDSWPVRRVKHPLHKGSWNGQSETPVVNDPIILESIQVAFFEGRVKMDKFIAAGANGKVYRCFCDIPAFGGICAVKIAAKQSEQLKNEIDILKSLSHEKVLTYYGSAETGRHLRLFMEYMPGGSLAAHIEERKALTEDNSRKFTLQILQAVSYLHSRGIIHRDVKGSNVLLDQLGNIKVADFGLSKRIQITGSKVKSNVLSYCGTPYWMAPEVIRGEGYERRADIWSLGCTSVEMLTGSPPLGHFNPQTAIYKIGSGPIELTLSESVSQDAKDFIKAALTWDPEDRPWSHELLRHRFLSPSPEEEDADLVE